MNTLPQRQEGQGLVEYALILVLVAVAVIVILQLLGPAIVLTYARTTAGLDGRSISGTGQEALLVTYSGTPQQVGNSSNCQITMTNVILVATDDGRIITNETVAVRLRSDNNNGNVVQAEAAASGLVVLNNYTLPPAPCPLNITAERQ